MQYRPKTDRTSRGKPPLTAAQKTMRTAAALFVLPLLLLGSCAPPEKLDEREAWSKIELDLTQLDDDGLRGPPEGKVAVSYEFCIPDTPECRAQVERIDRTVTFMPGSRGRIGAAPNQCLCIGSTHQKDYATVLRSLAELPYVDRIIECFFE